MLPLLPDGNAKRHVELNGLAPEPPGGSVPDALAIRASSWTWRSPILRGGDDGGSARFPWQFESPKDGGSPSPPPMLVQASNAA